MSCIQLALSSVQSHRSVSGSSGDRFIPCRLLLSTRQRGQHCSELGKEKLAVRVNDSSSHSPVCTGRSQTFVMSQQCRYAFFRRLSTNALLFRFTTSKILRTCLLGDQPQNESSKQTSNFKQMSAVAFLLNKISH